MRKLLRCAPFSQVARSSAAEYRPEVHEQKFKSWWSRLNSLSSKPASKVYLAQLANLFAYYNRQVTDTTKVYPLSISPSTSTHGEARSSPRISSIQSKETTRILVAGITTFRMFLTAFSLKIPKPSMKLYYLYHSEQRNGFPYCYLAHKLQPLRAVALGS
jgi:hypothetical protein